VERLLEDEYSHRGIDKAAQINTAYIDGSDYRRKFDRATENPVVNKILYNSAKEILRDRSGSHYESMRWIDGDTGKILAKVDYMGRMPEYTGEEHMGKVEYGDKIVNKFAGHAHIITIHNHPNSTAPSTSDLNAAVTMNYSTGFVVTHDGRLYKYTAKEYLTNSIYDFAFTKYLRQGLEFNAAMLSAYGEYAREKNISVKEVLQ
jgi:hypothetical protein